LIILEKVDWKDGLLKCLVTDAEVSISLYTRVCWFGDRVELVERSSLPVPSWFII